MLAERIIGVDFGTSTSVIRVKRYIDGVPAGLNQGDRLETKPVKFNGDFSMVPTLIQMTDKGTYYGADELVHKKGADLYQGFKVNLESSDALEREEARALTKEFLAYMAKKYKEQSEGGHLGEPDDKERTIISYPVKWSEETKRFMRAAAKEVGFPNVDGMDEAQAAINAVTVQSEDYLKKQGYLESGVSCNILLIDMGAGTTDLVLCRYTPGEQPKNEIICTYPKDGDILFGGQEVEEILRSYTKSLLPEVMSELVLKKIGIKQFKSWKETVVSPSLTKEDIVESFSDIDMITDVLDIEIEPYKLNRNKFEQYANEYLKKFPKLVNGCIKESGTDKNDIDLVILTGGHSQWYFVKEMLAGRMNQFGEIDLPQIRKNPDRIIHISRPQETVALGLVYTPMTVDFSKKKTELETNCFEKLKTQEIYKPIPETMSGYILNSQNKNDIIDFYRKNINSLVAIFNGELVLVRPDGTIFSNCPEFKSWNNIVSISCSCCSGHIVGLKKDGTVVAVGSNGSGQCEVQSWNNIVSISCCSGYTVGLKKDGTVVAAGDNQNGQCEVKSWNNIVSISCCSGHTVGLKKDGTVVAAGDNQNGQCEVKSWNNIVSISCCSGHTVGLKKDGTVVATGCNGVGQCEVQSWNNIVSISCDNGYTVGLKKDGTVIAIGNNCYGQCEVQSWNNIVSISCGDGYTVGLKNDEIVITGNEFSNFGCLDDAVAVIKLKKIDVFKNLKILIKITKSGEIYSQSYQESMNPKYGCSIVDGYIRKGWKLKDSRILSEKLF